MNYLDIVIVTPLLYGFVKGFTNGLIKEITGLLGLFIGVYVAISFSSYLHPKFEEFLGGYEQFIPIISFATLLVVSVIIIKKIGYIFDKLTKALALGFVSRLLGGVFGFLKIGIILTFLLSLVTDYELIDKQVKEKSVLIIPLQEVTKIIIPEINKHKKIIIEETKKSTVKAKNSLDKKINSE
jgi:membrane protein required for colicin V production